MLEKYLAMRYNKACREKDLNQFLYNKNCKVAIITNMAIALFISNQYILPSPFSTT